MGLELRCRWHVEETAERTAERSYLEDRNRLREARPVGDFVFIREPERRRVQDDSTVELTEGEAVVVPDRVLRAAAAPSAAEELIAPLRRQRERTAQQAQILDLDARVRPPRTDTTE